MAIQQKTTSSIHDQRLEPPLKFMIICAYCLRVLERPIVQNRVELVTKDTPGDVVKYIEEHLEIDARFYVPITIPEHGSHSTSDELKLLKEKGLLVFCT